MNKNTNTYTSGVDYAALAASDAEFVLTLIKNGEFDRALGWSDTLTRVIELAMSQQGITPSKRYIHTNNTITEF